MTGNFQPVPTLVHLEIFAAGDFIFPRGPAVEPAVQRDECQRLRDGLVRGGAGRATFGAFAAFGRAPILDPAAQGRRVHAPVFCYAGESQSKVRRLLLDRT